MNKGKNDCMKYVYGDEILQAAKELRLGVYELSESERSSLMDKLHALYAKNKKRPLSWHNFKGQASIQDETGWSLLQNFSANESVVIFFNFHQDASAWRAENMSELVRILYECTGFEFYVTNIEGSFLLCFNQHDFLIGLEDAREWIVRMKES